MKSTLEAQQNGDCYLRRPRSGTLTVGPLAINCAHRAVMANDVRLPISTAEFAVLEMLVLARGAAVSHERLTQAVFGRQWDVDDRSVDQIVLKLRRKLPPDEHGVPLIHTIRCVGFWIRAPAEANNVIDEIAAEHHRHAHDDGTDGGASSSSQHPYQTRTMRRHGLIRAAARLVAEIERLDQRNGVAICARLLDPEE